MQKYISHSIEDTQRIASEFAKGLKTRPCVIGLIGDLGAGKTVFVRALVDALGGNSEDVSSPTFAVLNVYDLGLGRVYHFDVYRLQNEGDVFDIGFYNAINDKNGIVVIEWIDRLMGLEQQVDFVVYIRHIDEMSREIEIVKNNKGG